MPSPPPSAWPHRTRAPLKAVVNLVGGYAGWRQGPRDPVEDFERQFRLNLRPAYLVTAAAVPELIAAGGGTITCVSSRAALRPFAGAAGYIASKAAVLAFVQAVAVEYAADGVRLQRRDPERHRHAGTAGRLTRRRLLRGCSQPRSPP